MRLARSSTLVSAHARCAPRAFATVTATPATVLGWFGMRREDSASAP
jgi:hypothetical protein